MSRPFFALLLSLCAVARSASAQPAPATPAEEASTAVSPALGDELTGQARDDYLTGRALYDADNFSGALIKFRQAFQRSGNPRLLWNMAISEKSLERYAQALQLLERCEREAGPRLSQSELAQVQSLRNTLQRLVSVVHVTVNEPGARVYVDQELVGTTPLAAVSVSIGVRTIRVTKVGFADYSSTHDISGAQDVRIEVALRKQEARLTVIAKGADTISIDGKSARGTRWQAVVRAGTHTIRVNARDMLPYEKELDLRAGEDRTVNVSLTPEPGGLPLGVWIGGGAALAAGLGVAGYFLFKPEPTTASPMVGTIAPGSVQLP